MLGLGAGDDDDRVAKKDKKKVSFCCLLREIGDVIRSKSCLVAIYFSVCCRVSLFQFFLGEVWEICVLVLLNERREISWACFFFFF